MRFSPRTLLLLIAALVSGWPSSAHASTPGPKRIAVCTCAASTVDRWNVRDRLAQVDTPPEEPAVRGVDPCTGEPVRTDRDGGHARPEGFGREVDPCTGEPLPLPEDEVDVAQAPEQPDVVRAVDPCTGEPLPPDETQVARAPDPREQQREPLAPPGAPPTDVTSPAIPAPLEPEPARTADADPDAAERNRRLLRLQSLALRETVRPGPAGSVSVPTAFGVETGEVFVGAAFQARTRYTDEADAGLVVGAGLGSRRLLALEVALTSYSTVRGGGPGETGGLSFKLHRALPGEASIAAGYENALLWGGSDADPALYLVGSKLLRRTRVAGRPLDAAVITVGVGNGRFRREDDDAANRETVNVFGAVGVRVAPPLSIAADWTGQDLNAGVSITPLARVPLVITPAVADILGTAGDGARFIVSVGFGVGFRSLF